METGEVAEVLRRLGGTASTSALLVRVPRHALRVAVAAGVVRRSQRGCYGLPVLPAAREAAARLGGAASLASAAGAWGMAALLPPARTTVLVRPNAHPQPVRGVRVGWAELSTAEVAARVTTPLRTVLDCAATLPFAEALAYADSALRDGLFGVEELRAAAERRRGPGAPAVRRVAALADPRAANPFESGLRAVLLDAGLTGFVPQLPIALASGWVRVDLADERLRLVAEADSFRWHGDRAALERDCRRYDELVRAGWVVLRVAWEHVMFDQDWLLPLARDVAARQLPTGQRLARRPPAGEEPRPHRRCWHPHDPSSPPRRVAQ